MKSTDTYIYPFSLYYDNEAMRSYPFTCPEGTWEGRLDHRAYGKKGQLMLLVTDLRTGQKHRFAVFWGQKFCPPKGGPNFKDEVLEGDCFRFISGISPKGYTSLYKAEILIPGHGLAIRTMSKLKGTYANEAAPVTHPA